jgi:tetratricopeptide (TPR) repeat protein
MFAAPALFAQAVVPRYDALVFKAMEKSYDELGGLALIAKASGDPQAALVRGIVYHNLSLLGLERYVEQAKATFEPLLPDPLAMGYYGSVITVQGGFASRRKNFASAASLLLEGSTWIDKAVAAAPDALPLRILRLDNGIQTSRGSPYKRYETIKTDLDALLAAAPSMDPDIQATVYFLGGEYYLAMKKTSDALAMYDKASRAAPDSKSGRQAAKKLAVLEN